jgi:hypothetical protein
MCLRKGFQKGKGRLGRGNRRLPLPVSKNPRLIHAIRGFCIGETGDEKGLLTKSIYTQNENIARGKFAVTTIAPTYATNTIHCFYNML